MKFESESGSLGWSFFTFPARAPGSAGLWAYAKKKLSPFARPTHARTGNMSITVPGCLSVGSRYHGKAVDRVSENGNWEGDAARFIASKLCFYSFMAARDRKTYSIKFAHKARGAGSSDSARQAPAHIKRFRGLFGGFSWWGEHLRGWGFVYTAREKAASGATFSD